MNKPELIKAILNESKIHHNISTLSMKLPEAPEDAPDDMFWDVCGQLVDMFKEDWEDNEPMNDKGNRNLCGCRTKGHVANPTLPNGACKKHDLWHVYTHGRMGATLYWDKYWDSTNSGFSFKYDEDELSDIAYNELQTMLKELQHFNKAVTGLMKSLPEELKYRYEEWPEVKADNEKQAIIDAIRPLTSKPAKNATQQQKDIYRLAVSLLKQLEA